jgi:hypothetical protein
MHPWTVQIDPAILRRLYLDESLTTAQIAARFGCGGSTILRSLRRSGIAARPKGPAPVASPPVADARPPWTRELAYAIGIITTDGCLSQDGRHLTVSSKDFQLLDTVRACLGLRASITPYRGGNGRTYLHMQWSSRRFHVWLVELGLMPAKSKRLAALAIPDEYFVDFLRRCIDGDGSIVSYVDRYHVAKNPKYVYTRLNVSLVSASPPFLEWVQSTARRLLHVAGVITRNDGRGRVSVLKYGKYASIGVLEQLYYTQDLPCLERKRQRAIRWLGVRKRRAE